MHIMTSVPMNLLMLPIFDNVEDDELYFSDEDVNLEEGEIGPHDNLLTPPPRVDIPIMSWANIVHQSPYRRFGFLDDPYAQLY